MKMRWIALTAALVIWLAVSVGNVSSQTGEEGRRQLEETLRRGAVACYATEGFYPPDVAYLEEHYGIRVDETRYTVFYEVFAENLMPQITVLQRET